MFFLIFKSVIFYTFILAINEIVDFTKTDIAKVKKKAS